MLGFTHKLLIGAIGVVGPPQSYGSLVEPWKDNETNRDPKTLAKKREDMGQEDARRKNDESSPIGSMYAIYIYIYKYGNICHQYTPNVSIYTIHGSYMGHGWIMLT